MKSFHLELVNVTSESLGINIVNILNASDVNISLFDIAREMINQKKYNILSQAAQAMLAQANQQPQ